MIDSERFLETLQSLTSVNCLVLALSGGCDSVVLLHLLADLPPTYRVRAIYVDHGLSQNSASWEKFCARLCHQLKVPFEAVSIAKELARCNANIESQARQFRYRILFRSLKSKEVLVTAQHADDQAETVLLQMLRGAGLLGLSAMPSVRTVQGSDQHIRPLLQWTRAEVNAYAKQNGLRWCEDESNNDSQYLRNYLRHHVVPVLRRRWPSLAATVSRSAAHCAEASQILIEVAEDDLKNCMSTCGLGLSVHQIAMLSELRQRNLWRYWLQMHQIKSLPSKKRLQAMMSQLLEARHDRCPSINWQNVSLSRYRETIYCTPKITDFLCLRSWTWQPQEIINKPEHIEPWSIDRCDLLPGFDSQAIVEVGPRQPGAKLNNGPGRACGSLKNWFQEKSVPPWLRDQTPILYQNGLVVGVALYQLWSTVRQSIPIEQ